MRAKLPCLLVLIVVMSLNATGGQITNCANITTNLSFYLTLELNGEPVSEFGSDQRIQYLFVGTSTNFVYFRRFPSGNFDFHLFDEGGKEVPKSQRGLAASGRPSQPSVRDLTVEDLKFAGLIVDNEAVARDELFRPKDVFNITNTGTYELEVRARICVIMTNGLPDYKAFSDGRNAAPSGYPFAKDFGILESPPLRVRFIKK